MSPMPIRYLADTRALLEPLRNTTDAAAKKAVDALITKAAGLDGDRCVDPVEAAALRSALEQVLPDFAPVSAADATAIGTALDVQLGQLTEARPKSTEVLFTSEGSALTRFRDTLPDETIAYLEQHCLPQLFWEAPSPDPQADADAQAEPYSP